MRRGHRRLVAVLAAAAIALTTAPATQAAEPLDWTVAPGFPVHYNDATLILETTIVPAEDAHTIEPYPIQRINIVNDSERHPLLLVRHRHRDAVGHRADVEGRDIRRVRRPDPTTTRSR